MAKGKKKPGKGGRWTRLRAKVAPMTKNITSKAQEVAADTYEEAAKAAIAAAEEVGHPLVARGPQVDEDGAEGETKAGAPDGPQPQYAIRTVAALRAAIALRSPAAAAVLGRANLGQLLERGEAGVHSGTGHARATDDGAGTGAGAGAGAGAGVGAAAAGTDGAGTDDAGHAAALLGAVRGGVVARAPPVRPEAAPLTEAELFAQREERRGRRLARLKTRHMRRKQDVDLMEKVITYTPDELAAFQKQFAREGESSDDEWDPFEGMMEGMVLQEKEPEKKPFDEFEYEKLDDDDFMAHPYIEPVPVRAMRHRDSNMFRRGIAPLCRTSVDEMQELGVGISLYFKLLQYLIVTLFLMTVVTIPTMYLNFLGSQVTVAERDPMGLSLLTLGNNGIPNGTACVGAAAGQAWCQEDEVDLFGYRITLTTSAYIIAFSDVLSSAIFLGFIIYFQRRVRSIAKEVDHGAVTASDYSVVARGFPLNTTASDVLEHFSALYQLQIPDWEFDGYFCGFYRGKIPRNPALYGDRGMKQAGSKHLAHQRKKLTPVENTDNSKNDDFAESWIADVVVAHKNGKAINKFLKAKELLAKFRAARARLKKYAETSKFANIEEEIKARKLLRKLEAKQEKDFSCVCAYITFNHEESYLNCLEDFAGSTGVWGWLFQPDPVRYKQGWYRLEVEQAPDPSNILWENLEAGKVERCVRSSLVYFMSLILLLISFAIIYYAQIKKQEFAQALPNLEVCQEDLPKFIWGSSMPPGMVYERNRTQDASCGPGESYVTIGGGLPTNVTATPCVVPCVSSESLDRCYLDTGVSFTHSTLAACYCRQQLQEAIAEFGFINGAGHTQDTEGELCVAFAEMFLASQAVTVAASLVVVMINTVLQKILQRATLWERNYTVTATARAITFKIFVALFLNTGCIVLIVYARPPNGMKFPIDGFFEGPFDDFTVQWYTVAGVAIMTTMAANVIAPHVAPMLKSLILKPLSIRRKKDKVTTQSEMNELYAGLPFEIETRYPLILNTVFVTLLYSSGLPILVPLAFVSLSISYWIDKYSLLRLYSAPVKYDEGLATFSAYVMPFGLLLHLLVGLWMYGNDDVLKSAPINFEGISTEVFPVHSWWLALIESMRRWDNVGATDKLTRLNTAPMFIFAACVLAWVIFRESAGRILLVIFKQLWWAVTCGGRLTFSKKEENPLDARKWIQYKSRQWLPPFTEEFRQQMDPIKQSNVTAAEARAGWAIMEQNGRKYKTRQWTESGIIDGIPHFAGETMRTWEVIAAQGSHSYDIMAHPKYNPAMRALHEEILKRSSAKGARKRRMV